MSIQQNVNQLLTLGAGAAIAAQHKQAGITGAIESDYARALKEEKKTSAAAIKEATEEGLDKEDIQLWRVETGKVAEKYAKPLAEKTGSGLFAQKRRGKELLKGQAAMGAEFEEVFEKSAEPKLKGNEKMKQEITNKLNQQRKFKELLATVSPQEALAYELIYGKREDKE